MMRIIKKEKKFCYSCMKEHDVQLVEIREENTIKNEKVEFIKLAEYCSDYDELTQNEDMIRINNIAFNDAYKKKVGLLTSKDIKNIRDKYGFSQSDLAKILGWGGKTITRYESYQVQDTAHNDLLIYVASDPKWVLDKLNDSKNILAEKAYKKYKSAAMQLYNEKSNVYTVESIESKYSLVSDDQGFYKINTLNLKKTASVINFIAGKIDFPYLTRMMKLLWYSDALNFKRNGKVITGLVYTAEPMGALPMAYKKLLGLEWVDFSFNETGDATGILFNQVAGFNINELSEDEMACIETVIEKFKCISTHELIEIMHEEIAYKKTESGDIISFEWASELSLS